MSKFQRSWLLFKSSISIITHNKQLLFFPIIIVLASTVIMLFFIAPALLRPTGFSYGSIEHWKAVGSMFFTVSPGSHGPETVHIVYSPTADAYLGFLYFVSMFL